MQRPSCEAVLLPYQQELMAATASAPVVVVEKSRRTGYTWAVAADAVLTAATCRQDGGMDVLYIGYNLDMAREFIAACAGWAENFSFAVDEVEETLFPASNRQAPPVSAFRLRFASGFAVLALSSRPRSLRGRQGFVIIDEAAFHDDLDEVLKAALALLIWGGKVLVVSTHNGENNPFARLVDDIRQHRLPHRLLRLDFDTALAQGLYRRICQTTGQDWSAAAERSWRQDIIDQYGDAADEELFVIPAAGGQGLLPEALLTAQARDDALIWRLSRTDSFLHLTPEDRRDDIALWLGREVAPTLLPHVLAHRQGHGFYLGMDYARSGDVSVIWLLARQEAPVLRRTLAVFELKNIPYAEQRHLLWWLIDALPVLSGAAIDATGNGESLAEETATRYGLHRIQRVKISRDFYQREIPLLKACLEQRQCEIPNDPEILTDHSALRLINGRLHLPRGKGRHGDSAIAHLLALSVSHRPAEIDYDYIT